MKLSAPSHRSARVARRVIRCAIIPPGDRTSILLVWFASLLLALFITPNYQQATVLELLYYSVYNVGVGAFIGFHLFDRLARKSLGWFAALSCLALVSGTLFNEALVEAILFRTGPINFEGVYYGLLEAATAATVFLVLRMFKSLHAPAGGPVPFVSDAASPDSGYFFARIGGETRRILAADVIYLKAERDYAHIVCASGRYFASESLKELLEKSAPLGLVRAHKSFAVNLRKVEWLTRSEAGSGDERVPVGRRYRRALWEAWQQSGSPSGTRAAEFQP